MTFCFCRFILALLVIVFAWWHFCWVEIVLTIIGALLAILALTSKCCCRKETCAEEPTAAPPPPPEQPTV